MKKIITSVIAATVVAASIGAMPARAIYIEGDANDSSISEGYFLVHQGEYDFLEPLFEYRNKWFPDGYEIYLGQGGVLIREFLPDHLEFDSNDDISNKDIAALLDEINIKYASIGRNCIEFTAGELSDIDAKKIVSTLKEQGIITSAKLKISRCSLSYSNYNTLSGGVLIFKVSEQEAVKKYLFEHDIAYNTEKVYHLNYHENGIDVDEVECTDIFRIVPEEDLELADKWHLFDEMFMSGLGQDALLFPAENEMSEVSLEAFGYVDGDANDDSNLTLNDAVAVLQFVALPDKYPLTAQGEFNADCDGNPGITGGDALWIQQQDAENF